MHRNSLNQDLEDQNNFYAFIDWDKTFSIYKITRDTSKLSNKRVIYKCPNCGKIYHIVYKEIKRKKSRYCKSCFGSKISESMKRLGNDPVHKAKLSLQSKQLWEDEEYRRRHKLSCNTEQARKRRSAANVAMWSDPDFRNALIEIFRGEKFRKQVSDRMKVQWSDKEYRKNMEEMLHDEEFINMASKRSSNLWRDAAYRKKILNSKSSEEYKQEIGHKISDSLNRPEVKEKMAVARANCPKVSNIQGILYSILDDLGVQYYREYNDRLDDPQCKIGPWTFDCVVPRSNKPDLLIECQGDYWHSLKKSIVNDKSKASYIANNFQGQYELKYLWEHEFANFHRINELIKYWLGITELETINFNFSDLEIRRCSAKDYKLLLSKYHYLPNAGRGGIAYGAYLVNELIAVCVFSPLSRQNIRIKSCAVNQVRDLSRLCIHPRYQKKNFASWFVSRCIKQLDTKFKCVISYCDTTFNHDGAVYKAANFKLDGEVRPDYWYASKDGWVMHKKTLYNHAVKMRMKEGEYAEANGYKKIWGGKKLKFIYER